VRTAWIFPGDSPGVQVRDTEVLARLAAREPSPEADATASTPADLELSTRERTGGTAKFDDRSHDHLPVFADPSRAARFDLFPFFFGFDGFDVFTAVRSAAGWVEARAGGGAGIRGGIDTGAGAFFATAPGETGLRVARRSATRSQPSRPSPVVRTR
jgi:hypothetical protein